MKKKTFMKKYLRLLTTAILTGTLLGAQVQPAFAENDTETVQEEEEKWIVASVTIEEPDILEHIKTPESDYGTWKWVYPDYMPTEDGEDCTVVLEPKEEDGKKIDVSWMKGWDEEKHEVRGYVTVYITGPSEEEPDASEENTEEDVNMPADDNGETAVENPADDTASDKDPDKKDETTDAEASDSDGEAIPSDTISDGENAESDDNKAEEADNTDQDAENSEIVTDEMENPDSELTDSENSDTEDPDQTVSEPVERPTTIFDMTELTVDERPDTFAEEELSSDEILARAAMNHTCEEIFVNGENLPWYVQFRVENGDKYEFSNQQQADIFVAFEFKLWDTLADEEYVIPEGEYVTVSMLVPEGYDYNIEHILPNGATESIIPTVDGNVLVFSTNCFSPFGIAGSTNIVGGSGMQQNYPSVTPSPKPQATPTPVPAKPTQTPVPTKAPEKVPTQAPVQTPTKAPVQNNNQTTQNSNQSQNNGQTQNNRPTQNNGNTASSGQVQQPNQTHVVNTGDNTQIILFVIIAVVALLLIIAVAAYLIIKNR